MGIVEDEQNGARADLRSAAEQIAQGQAALRQAVARAFAAKLTKSEIAELGNISRPTVSYWIREAGQWDSSGEA